MRTLTTLLTLFAIALAPGASRAVKPFVVSEARLEGVVYLIILGGVLGVINIIITGKRMR